MSAIVYATLKIVHLNNNYDCWKHQILIGVVRRSKTNRKHSSYLHHKVTNNQYNMHQSFGYGACGLDYNPIKQLYETKLWCDENGQ